MGAATPGITTHVSYEGRRRRRRCKCLSTYLSSAFTYQRYTSSTALGKVTESYKPQPCDEPRERRELLRLVAKSSTDLEKPSVNSRLISKVLTLSSAAFSENERITSEIQGRTTHKPVKGLLLLEKGREMGGTLADIAQLATLRPPLAADKAQWAAPAILQGNCGIHNSAVRLLTTHLCEPGSIPGQFCPYFRKCKTSRTLPLVGGFSQASPVFLPPFHSGATTYSPQSPSSCIKTSLLRAAQISSLHFPFPLVIALGRCFISTGYCDIFTPSCKSEQSAVRSFSGCDEPSQGWVSSLFGYSVPARLPPKRTGFNPRLGYSGFSHVGIVTDDAAGRRVFSGISRFPHSFIPVLFHTHLSHARRLSIPRS
ncbi:hypothetical protein PR048_009986 [Dryococelus australis]|uniref:Uncharacterized protein n=1 Tax=Dryococelus australis TaxID=614101 RepID=A0ABQ9I1G0_9NEOP|nr:hypothetical protein PR048_009986 [Dryococelus australis]